MEAIFPLLFVLGAVAVVAVAVLGWFAQRRRQEGLQLVAARLGLAFTPEDPFGLVDLPFELFSRGDGRGAENVLYGTWHTMPVHVFDYWYYEERSNGKTTSRTTYRYSCVVTPIDAWCPHLVIAPENVLSRLADAFALDDLQFESEEFNRAFNVRGDHGFGIAFCDARMMRWLLGHGDGRIFEVNGNRLLVAADPIDGADLPALLATVGEWVAEVPRVVFSLYAK